jgi:hypothetical protein
VDRRRLLPLRGDDALSTDDEVDRHWRERLP